MPEDRRGALAAWQALSPEQRQLAWRAAGGTAVLEDADLALVVARYAAAMRGQAPTRYLVAGLVVLVFLLGLAVALIAGGQTGVGIVVAALGVLGAGIGIGALQVRQAGFDRLYLASAATLAAARGETDAEIVEEDVARAAEAAPPAPPATPIVPGPGVALLDPDPTFYPEPPVEPREGTAT